VINKLSHLPILRMQSDARNNVMPLARRTTRGNNDFLSASDPRFKALLQRAGFRS
jgi:hypothetical protein